MLNCPYRHLLMQGPSLVHRVHGGRLSPRCYMGYMRVPKDKKTEGRTMETEKHMEEGNLRSIP